MSSGYAYKATTETRLSSTTATADADLTFPLVANKTYLIRGTIMVRAGAACDIKVGLGVGGATIDNAAGLMQTETEMIPNAQAFSTGDGETIAITAASLAVPATPGIAGVGNSTTYANYWTAVNFNLLLAVGGTGGDFEVLWSQATSSGTEPAAVLAGSAIQYEVLDDAFGVSYVIKSADESRDDPAAALTPDSELSLALDAGQPYLIEACALGWVQDTFNTRIRWCPDFTGTATTYHGTRITASVNTTTGYALNRAMSSGDFGAAQLGTYQDDFSNSAGSSSTSLRGAILVRGIITTDTAGDFSIDWAKRDNGGADTNPATIYAGSWIVARKLNVCSFTAPAVGDYCYTFSGAAYQSFTWSKPHGVKFVEVHAIGGGGGGGSGSIGGAQIKSGGQGGGGGGVSAYIFAADDLPSTVDVTIGQGGAGAAAISASTSNNNGNDGSSGTDTTFGAYLTAYGGGGGAAGHTGVWSAIYDNGGSGTLSTGGQGRFRNAANNGTSGGGNGSVGVGSMGGFGVGPGGGGGGGGAEPFEPVRQALAGTDSPDGVVAGGAAGTSGTTGGAGTAASDHTLAGAGGGGGGYGENNPRAPGSVGGNGAAGGVAGGGGGGGGAADAFGTPNSTSGAGGDGAPGMIRFCYYFSDAYEYSNEVGDGDAPEAPDGYTLDDTRVFRVLRKSAAGVDPRNPARPAGHPEYNDQDFWEAAYAAANALGQVPNGWVYGTHYPAAQTFGYWRVAP